MAEDKVILELKNCPWCGHGETLTEMAWRLTHSAEEKPTKPLVAAISKPLISASGTAALSLPMIPSLLTLEDACGKCGRPWVFRAEIRNVPASTYAQAMGLGTGLGTGSKQPKQAQR